MVFSSVAASSGLAEQGKLKRIAITSKARFPGVEDLPTVGETLPGYSFEGYIPLLAPAGLPAEIAERINRKIDEVLREPEVLTRFQTSVTRPAARIPRRRQRVYPRRQRAMESSRHGAQSSAKIIFD